MPTCSVCKEDLDIVAFWKDRSRSTGLSSKCKNCTNKGKRDKYRARNPTVRKTGISLDKVEYKKQWYQRNKAEVHRKRNERYHSTPEVKLSHVLRSRVRIALKRSLKEDKHRVSPVKYLGCSLHELRAHIEAKFKPGMNWSNWSAYGWHLDHIVPLSLFDLTKEEDLEKAVNYKNLQPLWWYENLAKSDVGVRN